MEDEIYLINQVVSRDTKLYRCVLPNINEPLEDNLHYWIPVYDPLSPLLSLLEARVGYFTCPDSTGIHQVTGLGFKPQRVQFFVTKGSGLQNHFCCCHGMMDENGNQNCLTWAGVWSNIFKGDSKRDLVIYTINSSGNSQVTASFVSMDDDGFTLDFSVVNTAFDIQWTAD
jgi:hypothetical protein